MNVHMHKLMHVNIQQQYPRSADEPNLLACSCAYTYTYTETCACVGSPYMAHTDACTQMRPYTGRCSHAYVYKHMRTWSAIQRSQTCAHKHYPPHTNTHTPAPLPPPHPRPPQPQPPSPAPRPRGVGCTRRAYQQRGAGRRSPSQPGRRPRTEDADGIAERIPLRPDRHADQPG